MSEKTTIVQTYHLEDILDESRAGGLGEEVIAHIFDTEGHAPESVKVCLCVRYDADDADTT